MVRIMELKVEERTHIMNFNMQEFIEYVLSFYGPGGLYDFNASVDEVKKATRIRLLNNDIPFEGDTFDREAVRDIILDEIRA